MKRSELNTGRTVLLLDAGNSRLKWALTREPYQRRQRFAARGVIELAVVRHSDSALMRLLQAAGAGARIYVCNVAGQEVQQRIRAAAKRVGLSAPRFARSTTAAAGVLNGYADTWRLGADRWVALIGARHEYPARALCIVGIGSAMTIDLLAADGRHQGGSIVPGPRMMVESLLQNTAGIRRRAELRTTRALAQALAAAPDTQAPRNGLFERDTRAALLAGARYACATLIERAIKEARGRLSGRPRLILTGGAAETVAPLLRISYRREDDLVLRGLAVLGSARR